LGDWTLKPRRSISQEEEWKYKQANAAVQRQVRKYKATWIEEECTEVEEGLMRNNPKRACEVVKSLRKEFRPRQCNVKDDKGRLLTNMTDILQRWKEYTEGLYSDNTSQVNQVDKSTDSEPLPPILETEVAKAVRHLPKGKATGYDELPAELLKLASDIWSKH